MTDTVQSIVAEKIKNPLVERVNKLPGTTFRMPSKGVLYTNGELDESVKDGEVLVKPLTSLDEIYMRTPDMLFQGTAIETVFKRAIPEIKKPLDLFANDVDYLLTALRKISNGNFITINHKCPHCGEIHNPKNPEQMIDRIREYDIPIDYFLQSKTKELSQENMDGMVLELSTGFRVLLRPATMREMLAMWQIDQDNIKTPEEANEMLLKSLLITIKSVDGIEDQNMILEWLGSLSTNVIREFSGKIDAVNNWGTTFSYDFACVDCGEKQTVDTVLNPLYFFILPSGLRTGSESLA